LSAWKDYEGIPRAGGATKGNNSGVVLNVELQTEKCRQSLEGEVGLDRRGGEVRAAALQMSVCVYLFVCVCVQIQDFRRIGDKIREEKNRYKHTCISRKK